MTENAPNQTGKNYFLAFCQLLKSRAIFQEKDGFQKHFTSLTHLHWLLSILYQIPDYKNSSVLYPEHTGIALINASCCKWLFLRHITLEAYNVDLWSQNLILRNNYHSECRQNKTLTDHWLQHRLKNAYKVREERNITNTRDVPRS